MEVSFLGSSNAFASEGRTFSSFIVDRKYQFDAPPTILPQLKKLEIPLDEIEVLFISHAHGDHFVGLPFLLLEYVYVTRRTRDLHIVGPPGCEEWLEDFSIRVYRNVAEDAGYKRIYHDATPGTVQKAGDLEFEAFPMNHVKADGLKAMGYRVKIGDKTISYTGDTMFCEEAVTLGDGADVYVVDCTYPDEGGPEHMGFSDIETIRGRITPETTIILTHMKTKPHVNGMANTLIADDLKTFKF
jgi:ribonuclease BN (tRNA processing enzyme)